MDNLEIIQRLVIRGLFDKLSMKMITESWKISLGIASGLSHNVALNNQKEVFTWGDGYDGQIGNNTTTRTNALPQKLLDPADLITVEGGETKAKEVIGKVAKIGASERGTFVITDEHEVYATGQNSNYQLSQGHKTNLKVIEKLYSQDGENYIDNIANVLT